MIGNTINRNNKVIYYIWYIGLVICLISMSGYALSTTDQKNTTSTHILEFIFICLLYRLYYVRTFTIKSLSLWILMVLSATISTIFNLNTTNLHAYTVMILIITVAFFITEIVSFDKFVICFINIMKLLTIIALCAQILIIILGVNLHLGHVENLNGAEYLNGYVFFIRVYGSELSSRNSSLFWEPGLYASFLNIALICEICFKKEKVNFFNIVLFILGVLISQSTAGYLLLALIIALAFFKRAKKGYILPFFIFILLFLIIYFNLDTIIKYLISMDYNAFHKLNIDEITNSTRFNSMLLNLHMYSLSPIFGNGFATANNLFSSLMPSWNVLAQTSTSTYYMGAMGVFGIFYTIAWINSILNLKQLNIYSRIVILLVILIIINKEPHETILFTYCILFYFTKESGSKKVMLRSRT